MCDPPIDIEMHMESVQQDELDYVRYVNLAKSLSSDKSSTDHEYLRSNTPNSDMFNPYPWIPSKSLIQPTQNKTKTPREFSIFTTPKKQNCYTELVEATEELCHKEAKWLSMFACFVFSALVIALIFITSSNSVRTRWHT